MFFGVLLFRSEQSLILDLYIEPTIFKIIDTFDITLLIYFSRFFLFLFLFFLTVLTKYYIKFSTSKSTEAQGVYYKNEETSMKSTFINFAAMQLIFPDVISEIRCILLHFQGKGTICEEQMNKKLKSQKKYFHDIPQQIVSKAEYYIKFTAVHPILKNHILDSLVFQGFNLRLK